MYISLARNGDGLQFNDFF